MRVVFKGSPAQIKLEMTEFLLSFPSEPKKVEVPATVTKWEPPEHQSCRSAAAPEVAEDQPKESEPSPKSSEIVCKFCAKYTGGEGWVRRHERHCKSNPERVPHPKEGQPPPWMKKSPQEAISSVRSETSSETDT